jgi:hypothetical protein
VTTAIGTRPPTEQRPLPVKVEPAVLGTFATVRRRKGIHAYRANPAQLRRHPSHHRGNGLAAVFQDGVDQGGSLGGQRQRPVPTVTGVVAPAYQPRIDEPVTDARGVGGMDSELRCDGAEILRSAGGNHDKHTQLGTRDNVLDFHDRLRHYPKQYVGGPKNRIDLGPIYLGPGVSVFDSLHAPQYHPGSCGTTTFAPRHRT